MLGFVALPGTCKRTAASFLPLPVLMLVLCINHSCQKDDLSWISSQGLLQPTSVQLHFSKHSSSRNPEGLLECSAAGLMNGHDFSNAAAELKTVSIKRLIKKWRNRYSKQERRGSMKWEDKMVVIPVSF